MRSYLIVAKYTFLTILQQYKPVGKVFWWSEVENTRENLYISALNFTCNKRENIESRKRGRKFCSIILLSLQYSMHFFHSEGWWKCFLALKFLKLDSLYFFPFSRKEWQIFRLPKSWIDEWQLSVILQLEKKTIFRKKKLIWNCCCWPLWQCSLLLDF